MDIAVFYTVSNWMNDISHKIDALSHHTITTANTTKTITNNNTRVINHYNSTTIITYLNATGTSSTVNNPPPNNVFLRNVASWGNKTCAGPYLSRPSFIFNMTATIVNTASSPVQTEVLFQLDNATRSDNTYTVLANSVLNIKSYAAMNYCQFTGPQDFEIVLMYAATKQVIETIRIKQA